MNQETKPDAPELPPLPPIEPFKPLPMTCTRCGEPYNPLRPFAAGAQGLSMPCHKCGGTQFHGTFSTGGQYDGPAYTANQMRAYARAALAASQPEPVAPYLWWVDSKQHWHADGKIERPSYVPEYAEPLYAQPPADLKDAQRYRKGAHGNCVNADGAELGMAWVKFENGKPIGVLWVTDEEVDAAMLSSAPTGEKP